MSYNFAYFLIVKTLLKSKKRSDSPKKAKDLVNIIRVSEKLSLPTDYKKPTVGRITQQLKRSCYAIETYFIGHCFVGR